MTELVNVIFTLACNCFAAYLVGKLGFSWW